jgi:hypothetical protein
MITDHYELLRPHAVKVCAWCFPGSAIFTRFPHLNGRRIVQTICAHHEREQAAISARACSLLYAQTTVTK